MQLDVFTLFPEHFDWFLRQRHVSNALALGNEMRLLNYRDTTPLNAGQVDDAPYGGGAGMVMRVDVVDAALEAAYGPDRDRVRKIALAPSGRLFDEGLAAELAEEAHIAFLCGRYEGFDERVVEHLADETISIGRYVLAGGELPAMVISRRGAAQAARRPRRRRQRGGGVLQRRSRGGAGVPALHAPAGVPRLGVSPRCCSRATTPACGTGGRSNHAGERTKMHGRHEHRGPITARISRRCARPMATRIF